VGQKIERRTAEGPRLALAMADMEACFGDFRRAAYWSAVAEAGLGRIPVHYRERHEQWQSIGGTVALGEPELRD
jgi:hypothetical protein